MIVIVVYVVIVATCNALKSDFITDKRHSQT